VVLRKVLALKEAKGAKRIKGRKVLVEQKGLEGRNRRVRRAMLMKAIKGAEGA
jgi:hypothetical protein